MSRYRGPKLRIVKRLGSLPGFGFKIHAKFLKYLKKKKKNINIDEERKKEKKDKKTYTIRLKEKQKLRYHYGLTEKNLVNYVQKARQTKTSTGKMLLQLLEMRLDNIIFKYDYAPTIPAARQLITHGHILLNGRIITKPSYPCQINDSICFKKPTLQLQNPTIEIQEYPINLFVNELLVIEYYSRSL